jgi:hypothetical protein
MKNVKKIIATILFLTLFSSVYSQDKPTKFGVKAGFNASTVYGDIEYGSQQGFYAGGLVDFTISKKIHLQPELIYSLEGYKDVSIGYLRLPVMGKYYTSDKFNIQAGASLGVKTNADKVVDDSLKPIDFSLAIGAAYELPKGLFFQFRYNVGINNINDTKGGSEFRNSTAQIGIGYMF